MLVSIIINNYNYGRYLRQCIDSALNQTYKTIEVIVVDDGSTDDSPALIASYGTRIKSFLKQNGGQGSAFNEGFNISEGALVLFLDSDDVLCSTAIQECVIAWDPRFSKIHFSLSTIDDEGRRLPQKCPRWPLDFGDVLPTVLRIGEYCAPPCSGNLFSRSFLLQVMPMPASEWRDSADCYVISAAPFYGEIGKLDQVLGEYRQHAGSITDPFRDGCVSLQALAGLFRVRARQRALVAKFANDRGLTLNGEAITGTAQFYKLKLISARLAPHLNASSGEGLWKILFKLFYKIYESEEITMITKFAYVSWALLVVLTPKIISSKVCVWAFPDYKSPLRTVLVNYDLRARSQS